MFEEYFNAEDTKKIMSSMGGLDIRVPCSTKGVQYELIKERLGDNLAQRFISVFAGEALYIPQGKSEKLKERNQHLNTRFHQLLEQGQSKGQAINVLATETGLTSRTIMRIIN